MFWDCFLLKYDIYLASISKEPKTCIYQVINKWIEKELQRLLLYNSITYKLYIKIILKIAFDHSG